LVEILAEVAGKKPELARIPRTEMLKAGGHPMGPKLYFGVYFDMPPITLVITKAQRMLGFHPTDFHAGLKETYRWYLRHHERNTSNYAFEDKLLALRPTSPPPA
jgi:nucleoside-diphosphate-sugar epimerase